MFEDALIESQPRPQAKGKLLTFPLAVAIHGVVILIVVVAQLWAVDELPEPPIQVSFWAAPPPPPPPPPPPRAAAPPKAVQPVVQSMPVVQPKEIPQDIPKASTGSGVEGGVEGGIEGGEMGGVVGGIPGGVPGPTPVPEPTDAPPIRVGGDVLPPVKTREVIPVYPDVARKARIQGQVIMEAIIDREGNVTAVRVLRGLPMGLTEAATDALQRTKFRPATTNGRPVAVYYVLTVTFKLD
jgi:protein TonB